jgi:hypothetical protein
MRVGAWAFSEGSGGFYKQHGPTRTPEGHLLVSTQVNDNNEELVAREYEIDDVNQLLHQVWECGAGSGIEARHGGETRRLAGGNTTLSYGPGSHFREYTPACELVWELSWADASTVRKGTFLADLYAFAP